MRCSFQDTKRSVEVLRVISLYRLLQHRPVNRLLRIRFFSGKFCTCSRSYRRLREVGFRVCHNHHAQAKRWQTQKNRELT